MLRMATVMERSVMLLVLKSFGRRQRVLLAGSIRIHIISALVLCACHRVKDCCLSMGSA